MITIPVKYLPKNLTNKNKRQQFKMLMKSKNYIKNTNRSYLAMRLI